MTKRQILIISASVMFESSTNINGERNEISTNKNTPVKIRIL